MCIKHEHQLSYAKNLNYKHFSENQEFEKNAYICTI